MKTTVVPAQITTVEDKIAGSLNFVQIILLVFSLIIGTAFYGLVPPKLHLSTIKIVLIVLQLTIFGLLALRYRGRIIADWLVIILRFKARPRIYVFDKNDISGRKPIPSIKEIIKEEPVRAQAQNDKSITKYERNDIPDRAGSVIAVRPSKKGGLDVLYREA